MIRGYFGVPGCGKTTELTKIAIKELKRKVLGLSKYKNIYTINFRCSGCIPITFDDLATYKIYDSLILIDEITMSADNRDFKTFSSKHRDFFLLHRHLGLDIIYATQNFENVDKKIRDITCDLWYMSKSVLPILKSFTCSKRIYRNININEHTSELTLGYRFCNFLESLFTSNYKITYRKPLYKYFDSFDELTLEERDVYPIEDIKYPKFPKYSLINVSFNLKNKIKKVFSNVRRKFKNKFIRNNNC